VATVATARAAITRVWPIRTVDPLRPTETATRAGLAYTLWLPAAARAGVVVIHGAGSVKESHHDFARAAVAAGLGCLCFDLRGHGGSPGPLDGRALGDVAIMARLLRDRLGEVERTGGQRDDERRPDRSPGGARRASPIVLRGSSLGGYLAIVSAAAAKADAVIAICPAAPDGLRRGLTSGRFSFPADVGALVGLLDEHDPGDAVAGLPVPVLVMHAEGDERVPVAQSRALAARFAIAGSRLIVVPGGHHRSVQHDPELQAFSLRWITRIVETGTAEARARVQRAEAEGAEGAGAGG
jgi:alpha-beta hydrolase superfamily lysophospholipase